MVCPNGSEMKHSEHQVKTMKKALEYYPADESHLPITIEMHTAYNGRVFLRIWDKNGNIVFTKG
jgi:hypothetical protein